MPEKVCFGSTITKLRLHREGKCYFKQEKLTVHFFECNHNGTYKDIKVQIIDHCDPNDQETREDLDLASR